MLTPGSRSAHRRTLPLALALLLFPALASAQAPPTASAADRAAARELAKEGTAALVRQDYAEAADRFARAGTLVHAPTLTLGLARAQVGLGKWLVALDLYNQILQEGAAPGSPPAFVKARKDARKDLDDLEPRVPSVIIVVKGAARVVTLDGVAVPAATLGVKRPVDPGMHVLHAEGDGLAPADVTVTLAERKVESVTLELKPPPRVAPPPPVAPPPVAPPPVAPPPVAPAVTPPPPVEPVAGGARPGSVQRTLGFVGLGAGGAGLLVGAVTGVLVLSKHGEIAKACPLAYPHPCNDPEILTYDTLGAASTGGFIVGGALVVTGIVLLATAPKAYAATNAGVVPLLGPGWVGARGRF
jgi:hypothetical protein